MVPLRYRLSETRAVLSQFGYHRLLRVCSKYRPTCSICLAKWVSGLGRFSSLRHRMNQEPMYLVGVICHRAGPFEHAGQDIIG